MTWFSRLFFYFLIFFSVSNDCFSGVLDASFSLDQKSVSYARVFKFKPREETIFFFDSDTREVRFVTSQKKASLFLLDKGTSGVWFSRDENLSLVLSSALQKDEIKQRSYLNQSLMKPFENQTINIVMGLFMIFLIALSRVFFQDAFYAFLVPFKAYSTTVEKMAQTNRMSILVSVLFLVFVLFSVVFLLFEEITWGAVLWNFGLILLYFIIKWFALNRANVVFGEAGFSRLHLLEFLRYGIFLFVIIYFIMLVLVLNDLKVDFVYEIVLFPYLIVWFIRLWMIYNKRYNHKFLYFFSYLCATEVIPIFMIVFFWKEKI